eukprot:Mrub_01396.p1 GENE.Mrub_01396~~Mrub_01396.p1  ORF type:complete len:718 (-),score=174.60 Mrub_01396:53-2206(-)
MKIENDNLNQLNISEQFKNENDTKNQTSEKTKYRLSNDAKNIRSLNSKELSTNEVDNVIRLFNHFDPNGDQNISFEEAIPMAKAFDINREELVLLFNEIDDNGDGFLQCEEWISFLNQTSSKNYIKKKILDKLQDNEWLEDFLNKPLNESDAEIDIDQFLNEIENNEDDNIENDQSNTHLQKQKTKIKAEISILKNKLESQSTGNHVDKNAIDKLNTVNNDFYDGIRSMLSLESKSDLSSIADDSDHESSNHSINGDYVNKRKSRRKSLKGNNGIDNDVDYKIDFGNYDNEYRYLNKEEVKKSYHNINNENEEEKLNNLELDDLINSIENESKLNSDNEYNNQPNITSKVKIRRQGSQSLTDLEDAKIYNTKTKRVKKIKKEPRTDVPKFKYTNIKNNPNIDLPIEFNKDQDEITINKKRTSFDNNSKLGKLSTKLGILNKETNETNSTPFNKTKGIPILNAYNHYHKNYKENYEDVLKSELVDVTRIALNDSKILKSSIDSGRSKTSTESTKTSNNFSTRYIDSILSNKSVSDNNFDSNMNRYEENLKNLENQTYETKFDISNFNNKFFKHSIIKMTEKIEDANNRNKYIFDEKNRLENFFESDALDHFYESRIKRLEEKYRSNQAVNFEKKLASKPEEFVSIVEDELENDESNLIETENHKVIEEFKYYGHYSNVNQYVEKAEVDIGKHKITYGKQLEKGKSDFNKNYNYRYKNL